jgi:hypothetical protein
MVKYTMVLQQWTGWHKSKKEVLQLLLLQQLVNGIFNYAGKVLHCLPHYRYSSHVDFTVEVNVYLMVSYLLVLMVLSLNQKLTGD